MSETWTNDPSRTAPAEPEGGSDGPRVPRWAWWLVLCLTLLVLGGVSAIIWADANSGDTAEARTVAEGYLDAIAEGDAEAANVHARIEGRGRETELLRSDALSEAEEWITDVELSRLRVDSDGDEARAEVEYELEGEHHRTRLELARDADGWYVREGITVELPFDWGGDSAPFSLRGFDEVVTSGDVFDAYPAVYSVEPPNEFFEVVGDGRMVIADDSDGYRPPYDPADGSGGWTQPTDAYWEELQRHLDEWYDACAERTEASELRECGIEVDESVGLEGEPLEVEVQRYPSVIERPSWAYGEVDLDGEFRVWPASGDRADAVDAFNSYADIVVEMSSDGALVVEVVPY